MNGGLTQLRARKLAWLLSRPRWWRLVRRGIGPSLEHSDLLAGRQFGTILDVGANVGQFTLWGHETLSPQRVVCVEPQPDAARSLRSLAAALSCDVAVVEAALGDSDRTAMLHVTAAADSSSVLAPRPEAQRARSGLRVTAERPVTVRRGDDIFGPPMPEPVLLKIDVQGSELEVLRGMRETLRRVHAIVVEVSFARLYRNQSSPSEVIEFLGQHCFELRGVSAVPGGTTGWTLDQADLLFERVGDLV